MPNQGALAKLDDNAAIARIASGTLSKEIAKEYGVTPYAVRLRLYKHPDYKRAIEEQAESFVENALAEVIDCPLDAIAIARARVRFDCAHKWAAARDPARWGAKATLDINLDLGGALQAMSERLQAKVIEHDVAQQVDDIADATLLEDK